MCPWELLDQQGTARQRESWHGHGHGEEGVASVVGGCMGRAHAWQWSGFLGFHCVVAAAKAVTLLWAPHPTQAMGKECSSLDGNWKEAAVTILPGLWELEEGIWHVRAAAG